MPKSPPVPQEHYIFLGRSNDNADADADQSGSRPPPYLRRS